MTAKVSDEIKQKIVKYLKTDKAKFVDPNTGKRTTKIDSYKLNEFVKNLLNLKLRIMLPREYLNSDFDILVFLQARFLKSLK